MGRGHDYNTEGLTVAGGYYMLAKDFGDNSPSWRMIMTFKRAIETLGRDDRFKATVSAMNTLLIQKGIYSQAEFEAYFCQWAESKGKQPEESNRAVSANY